MTRSPLFYPLNRGMDAEAGGAAELQTDVMRFMAIISMCLVAIFALVQSLPIEPVEPVTADRVDATPEEVIAPATLQAREITVTRPQPAAPRKAVAAPILQRPAPGFKPKRMESPPARPQPPATDKPPTVPAGSESAQTGFTLQFESDQALTTLVERDVVGLYAIAPGNTKRMHIESGEVSFWKASTPERIHEMDLATVPAIVVSTYARTSIGDPGNVKWGVSIPATMSRQLHQVIAEHDGGSLIIGFDGVLRLEQ